MPIGSQQLGEGDIGQLRQILKAQQAAGGADAQASEVCACMRACGHMYFSSFLFHLLL